MHSRLAWLITNLSTRGSTIEYTNKYGQIWSAWGHTKLSTNYQRWNFFSPGGMIVRRTAPECKRKRCNRLNLTNLKAIQNHRLLYSSRALIPSPKRSRVGWIINEGRHKKRCPIGMTSYPKTWRSRRENRIVSGVGIFEPWRGTTLVGCDPMTGPPSMLHNRMKPWMIYYYYSPCKRKSCTTVCFPLHNTLSFF